VTRVVGTVSKLVRAESVESTPGHRFTTSCGQPERSGEIVLELTGISIKQVVLALPTPNRRRRGVGHSREIIEPVREVMAVQGGPSPR
jgi:hypothetical protein